jgi:hypothetical protein
MTHRRPARIPAAARAARSAALGLGLLVGLAAPGAAQSRHAAPASSMRAFDAPAVVPAGTAPDPRLGAEDVVAIVLSALADAGARPDAALPRGERALALAFAFASPANRAAVGSLESFTAMVQDDAYRPLVGHRQASRGVLHVTGERATQRVVVTAADGARVAYTFTLARQATGAFRGCWMTEGVEREAPSRLAAAQTA